MSVATVRRVFSSDNYLLQAAREKSSPVIYSIKKILHQIITLGFGKGLEQARVERREHEIGQMGTDILAKLPSYEGLNSQTDILLHENREQGYSLVQKGHLLVLYTDGLFIPDVEVLADLKEKSAYTNLISKLSEVKGTDEWKAHVEGLIKSVKAVEHHGQIVVKHLNNLIFACVRNNDTEFVNFAINNLSRDEHYTPAKGEKRIKAMLDTARVNSLNIKAGSNDYDLMLKFFLARNPEVCAEFATLFHSHPDLVNDLADNRDFRSSQFYSNLKAIYYGVRDPLPSGNTVSSLAQKLTSKPILGSGIIKKIPEFASLHTELEGLYAYRNNLVAPFVHGVLKHKSSKIENEMYNIRLKIADFEAAKGQKPYELKETNKRIDNLNEELQFVVALLNKASTGQEKISATEVIDRLEAELASEGQKQAIILEGLDALKPAILTSFKDQLQNLQAQKDNHIATLQAEIERVKDNSRFIAELKYGQDLPLTDHEGRITLEQIQRDIADGYFENIDELIRDYKASHFHGTEESVKQATFLLTKTVEKSLSDLATKAQTFWSKETIDSLTVKLLLDEASQAAAITMIGYDLKHTAFRVVMTEADKARRDYKNSLKGKVDEIALRSLKQLPKIINSRNWELLGTTLEIYYKALGNEPVRKVNDLLFHTIEKELKKFGENEQSIVEAFKAYKESNFPYVLVKECWLQTTYYIPSLVKRLTNSDWVIDESMKEYKADLISDNNPAISALETEIPRCIKARDWYGLQKSLIGNYFHNLYNEPARKANGLMLWSIINQLGKDDEPNEEVIKAFIEYTNATHTLSDEELVDERYDEIAKNVAKIRLVNDLQMSDKGYDLLDKIIEGFYSHDWNSLPSLICSYSERFSLEELNAAARVLKYKNYIFIFNISKNEIAPLVKMLDVPNASANAKWMLNEIKEWLKW